MIEPVAIENRQVGPGHSCYIIAEAGVNHNGDMALAHQLIDAAVKAGADAIKFQSFVTEDLITADTPKANYQVETTGEPGSQYNMLKSLELTGPQHAELKAHCDESGILYLCTPYENKSVDMLDELGIGAYKIASTDTTNIPFLRYLASKNRSVILSTGMSTLGEVELAVNALWEGGLREKTIILHCTSEYPTPIEEANLRAIGTMERAFACPIGFSDHTPGIGVSPWAVAVGACMLEKHFTLDRDLPGPDHRASLEPNELATLVQTVRQVETALGDGRKRPMPSEIGNKPFMQKSIVAVQDIAAGETIAANALSCKRPATGLSPALWDDVVGKSAARPIKAGEILNFGAIAW